MLSPNRISSKVNLAELCPGIHAKQQTYVAGVGFVVATCTQPGFPPDISLSTTWTVDYDIGGSISSISNNGGGLEAVDQLFAIPFTSPQQYRRVYGTVSTSPFDNSDSCTPSVGLEITADISAYSYSVADPSTHFNPCSDTTIYSNAAGLTSTTNYTNEEVAAYCSSVIASHPENAVSSLTNLAEIDTYYDYNFYGAVRITLNNISMPCLFDPNRPPYTITENWDDNPGENLPPYIQSDPLSVTCPQVLGGARFITVEGYYSPFTVPYYNVSESSVVNFHVSCLAPFYCYYEVEYLGENITFPVPEEKILNGGKLSYCLVGEKLTVPQNRAFIFPKISFYYESLRRLSTFADSPHPGLIWDENLLSPRFAGYYTPPVKLSDSVIYTLYSLTNPN